MKAIDLNRPVKYLGASLRYFEPVEYHITRVCPEDVLLLVFDGTLRFTEAGQDVELSAGQYYIQQRGLFQQGRVVSDSPKYLYVHFLADWDEPEQKQPGFLPFCGTFCCERFASSIEQLDSRAHNGGTLVECEAVFYEILSQLYKSEPEQTLASRIATFLEQSCQNPITLEQLVQEFHFSKNHIIHIFQQEYGITPMAYVKQARLKRAQWLLVVTSKPAAHIAALCGFHDYPYFYRAFRQQTGLSPQQWRQLRQNG